jgi:multiple sugar transport system permease protein
MTASGPNIEPEATVVLEEEEAPKPARLPKAPTGWRRRLRSWRACFLFLLPFLYAASQSLASPQAQGRGRGPAGPRAAIPWYPSAQRTYECSDSGLCTYQPVVADFGDRTPDGPPVDVSKRRNRTLPVFEVPGHGALALLHAYDLYTDIPSEFIDPATNTRVGVVVDAATLAPAWELRVSLDSYTSAFKWAESLTHAAPGGYLRWLVNSGIIAGLSAIGAVLSSVVVAYGFARFQFKGRDVWFLVLIGTVLIPYPVTLIPQYIIYHTIGWEATFLPLTVPAFFGNAYYIFLLRQYFMTLPIELDEAAMVDGAGHFAVLTRIIVPQAWPAIAAVALFQFLFSWNDYMGALIYLSSWEDLTTVSLGLSYFATSQSIMQAGAIVSLIVPVALAFLAQKAFMRGLVISGVET